MPLERAYEGLKAVGFLQLLDPMLPPSPLPRCFKEDEFCKFHQSKGHRTNVCLKLKHAVQDLIDKKIINEPKDPNEASE